jgi:hypothetical protein
MKRDNILRTFIVENSEVLLLQAANRRAGFVRDLDVESDFAVWVGWRRRRGSAGLKLGRGILLTQCRGDR